MDRGDQLATPVRDHSEFLPPGAEIDLLTCFFPFLKEESVIGGSSFGEGAGTFVSGLLPRGTTWDRIFLGGKQEVNLSRAPPCSGAGGDRAAPDTLAPRR